VTGPGISSSVRTPDEENAVGIPREDDSNRSPVEIGLVLRRVSDLQQMLGKPA
jgi:hypothetical protein